MASSEEDVAERLLRPDGIVFKSDLAITQFVRLYTVALIAPGRPGLGSGLLLELWGRFFILTAGHVVREVRLLGGPVNLVIAHDVHDAKFDLARNNLVVGADEDDADFGYFELPAHDAERVRARDKVFANPRRVAVQTTTDDDLFVVSGFPRHHIAADDPQGQSWVRHCQWTTSAAGTRSAPASPPSARTTMRLHDLSLDPSATILDYNGRNDPQHRIQLKATIDPMQGASGGPCWQTFSAANGEQWAPEDMKVIAIHRASMRAVLGEDSMYWYAREVSVGHHLKMIAEDFPELREQVLATWPTLDEFPSTASLR
jgi:hypothetical protein